MLTSVWERTSAALALAAALYALAAVQGAAVAQNSTQAPPPSSAKISGGQVEGDPNGAVRALGSGDDGETKGKPMVKVPNLGGEGESRPGGTPQGTR